ncbi:MAG: OmpA family protein [Bacteroidota bacterium]
MKTIITGAVLFLIWTILSTCYYLNTRGFCGKDAQLAEAPVIEVLPEAVEPEPEPAPEPRIESPGSFSVNHDFDRSEIIRNAQFDSYLIKVLAFREQNESSQLSVVGFADHSGPEDYNYQLGLRRATSVRNYMVSQGISEQIVSVSSNGESSPVATNATAEGRAQNRRTEIQISN